jgi:exodeoxyribonuclease V gamma subunit
MNGGEFPKSQNLASFDICKSKRKYTDRNETEEDRLLILETILCTREKLFLSFQGQSNKNNDLIPPSVVVDEILEQLDELLEFHAQSAIRSSKDAFWVEHPLQSFSKSLFKENERGITPKDFFSPLGCKSFSQASCDGARALAKESNIQEEFWSDTNNKNFDSPKKISLIELKSFWKNPSIYFLEKVLQIATHEENNLLPVSERLENSAWEDSSIKRELIQNFLNGNSLEENFRQFKNDNHLPPGQLGITLFKSLIGELKVMFQRTSPNFSQKIAGTCITANLKNIEIDGDTGTFFENKSFFFNGSKMKGKFCMEGIIQHLFNNAFSPFRGKITTVVGATDKSFIFSPFDPETSKIHLYKLIELQNHGITNPLPFFPNSSLAWLEQTINHRKRKPTQRSNSPLTCAQNRWSKNPGGEKYDFANKLIYPQDPWGRQDTLNLNEIIMGLVDELGEFISC